MMVAMRVGFMSKRVRVRVRQKQTQKACYSRISIGAGRDEKEAVSAFEDRWVFKKSEILGNILLQEGGAHQNMVLSPLSLQVVLSLIAAGSMGRAKRQILKLLDADSVDTLNYLSSHISHTFSSSAHHHPQMRCSNALSLHPSVSLKPSFQRTLNSYYKAPLLPFISPTQVPPHS